MSSPSSAPPTPQLTEVEGLKVAVEGCGHGTLDEIYEGVKTACEQRGWDGVDLVVIGGDFQAVRNAADLTVMSCPVKYRHIGGFWKYYNGTNTAPYLTIFIAGNHEAASHLWELYYGGWVAPKIYYVGASNVLRVGPLRIAGLSGIWAGHDYRLPHHERIPFGGRDVKSFYHVRELEVRKLLMLRSQVDVGLSHDWPRAIERHGDEKWLFMKKPYFKKESLDGTLGSPAAQYVMDRLRPAYWFSAHMHVKFSAVKTYEDDGKDGEAGSSTVAHTAAAAVAGEQERSETALPGAAAVTIENPDEIDLDMEDDGGEGPSSSTAPEPPTAPIDPKTVPDNLRAQLPASFTAVPSRPQRPPQNNNYENNRTPGQPVPPGITNKSTRFLALSKCLPGHHYLQLLNIPPLDPSQTTLHSPQPPSNTEATTATTDNTTKVKKPRYPLQYDPEWLSILRVFSGSLPVGHDTPVPPNKGEPVYAPLIDEQRVWVEENIVQKGKLVVPENFEMTAPSYVEGEPEIVEYQPDEYTNVQTTVFCEMLGVDNLWDASEEERKGRRKGGRAKAVGAPGVGAGGGGGWRGGGGGGRGGGRGRGRGRGRGGRQ